MTDTTIPIRDAGAIGRARRVLDDGPLGIAPVNAEHPEQRAAQLAAIQGGAAYTQKLVTLTARQIAGTDPIIPANPDRRVLQFGASSRDFAISLAAEQLKGMPIFATARDDLLGKLCPLSALYLATGSGFAIGDTFVIWEA